MGLAGFQRARREAAARANCSAEGMGYDEAIAILAQPLLSVLEQPMPEPVPIPALTIETVADELPSELASELPDLQVEPQTAARRKPRTKTVKAI